MKKLILGLTLSTSLFLGSAFSERNKAHAGLFLFIGGITAAYPVVIILSPVLMAAGLYPYVKHDFTPGAFLFALDEVDQSLRAQLNQVYPELNDYLVTELENLIMEKSLAVDMKGNKQLEITLSEAELAPVLEILYSSGQAELAEKILADLTRKII